MLFFPTSSLWRADVRTLALDPNSAFICQTLRTFPGRNINTVYYSVPIYTVPVSQPTVPIFIAGGGGSIKQTWQIPMPTGALPSAGADKHITVVRGNELWGLGAYNPETAKAGYGGHIKDWTTNSGVYPAATKEGNTAPGFDAVGGLITLADCAAGKIDHALAFACPARAGWLARPANRTDGKVTSPNSVPEGSKFRIDPNFNCATITNKFARMMAEAAQKYGMVCSDMSSALPFKAEDPSPLLRKGLPNPYTKPGGYFAASGGVAAILAAFPWSRLQLTRMELAKYP